MRQFPDRAQIYEVGEFEVLSFPLQVSKDSIENEKSNAQPSFKNSFSLAASKKQIARPDSDMPRAVPLDRNTERTDFEQDDNDVPVDYHRKIRGMTKMLRD